MDLAVRGITGSGIGVYMAYGNRESSAGGPFFRDIEQQGASDNQLYNYMFSAHNQTEAQRLNVLYGPYALMISGTTTPAAPDMSFMDGPASSATCRHRAAVTWPAARSARRAARP